MAFRGQLSGILRLVFGIPQGSVLGPLLFLLYTAELLDIIKDQGMKAHSYADDAASGIPWSAVWHPEVGFSASYFPQVSNLGVHLDSQLTMQNHVAAMCRSCFFQLRQLRTIRSSALHGRVAGHHQGPRYEGSFHNRTLMPMTQKDRIHTTCQHWSRFLGRRDGCIQEISFVSRNSDSEGVIGRVCCCRYRSSVTSGEDQILDEQQQTEDEC